MHNDTVQQGETECHKSKHNSENHQWTQIVTSILPKHKQKKCLIVVVKHTAKTITGHMQSYCRNISNQYVYISTQSWTAWNGLMSNFRLAFVIANILPFHVHVVFMEAWLRAWFSVFTLNAVRSSTTAYLDPFRDRRCRSTRSLWCRWRNFTNTDGSGLPLLDVTSATVSVVPRILIGWACSMSWNFFIHGLGGMSPCPPPLDPLLPVIATDWNNHTEESNTVSDIIILV